MFGNTKSQNIVSGTVERVGFVGYIGDVHYMTLLIQGSNKVFRVLFAGNDPVSNAASLTQSGDIVEFEVSEDGQVKTQSFTNKTVSARLQE